MNVTDLIDQLTTIESLHGRIEVTDQSGHPIDDVTVDDDRPEGDHRRPTVVLVAR